MRLDQAWESWDLDLRASRRADRTRETYKLAVDQLADWLKNQSRSVKVKDITRNDIRGFILHVHTDRSPSTARQRHSSLKVFFKWLVEEGDIESNPMIGVKAPKVPEKPIPVVSQRAFDLLVESCDATFTGRRDEAIIRLLWDTGMRLGELIGLKADDVSFQMDVVWVEGKGEKTRQVPYTEITARALNRYVKARDRRDDSMSEWLWLGERGRLGKTGVEQMLRRRCERLGIAHISPHQFRHAAADRFLTLGMQEGEVMEILGWSRGSRTMLDRYGRSVANRRAFDTYRRLVG